jgi:hypothetical protein
MSYSFCISLTKVVHFSPTFLTADRLDQSSEIKLSEESIRINSETESQSLKPRLSLSNFCSSSSYDLLIEVR